MKFRILCFLTINMAVAYVAFGQYDFRKGYVVTHQNDTLKGYIDYGNSRHTTYVCYFKEDSLSKLQEYTPGELSFINVDNKRHYVSKEVKINNIKQKLFLEYLLDGSLDLYYLVDKNDSERYFIEREGVIYELFNSEKYVYKDGKPYLQNRNEYIGLLKYLVQDSPKTLSKVERTKFEHKSLISLTKSYHQDVCDTVNCIVYSNHSKKLNDAKWQIKIGSSLNYSISEMTTTNHLLYTGPRVIFGSENLDPRIVSSNVLQSTELSILTSQSQEANFQHSFIYPSFFVNFSKNSDISFQVELAYKVYQIETSHFSLQNRSISIPVLFRKEFWYLKKMNPFIELGFSYNYHFDPTLDRLTIEYTYPIQNNDVIDIASNSLSFEDYTYKIDPRSSLGLMIGVGLNYDFNEKNGLLLGGRLNGLGGRLNGNSFLSSWNEISDHLQFSTDFTEISTTLYFGYFYRLNN